MNFIVAVDKKNGIGKNNDLLVSLPLDMKYFRETTSGKTVIMGRKTYESLPKRPLPNRKNIIISRTMDENSVPDDVLIFRSIESFLTEFALKQDSENIFVIGGAEIYNQMMDFCEFAHITHIFEDFDADVFINELNSSWKVISKSEEKIHEGTRFQFTIYQNSDVKSITN